MIQRRPAVLVATILSLAVLSACCIGGWLEIREYGDLTEGLRTFPQVPPAVQAFIGSWIVLTIAILAVWIFKLR